MRSFDLVNRFQTDDDQVRDLRLQEFIICSGAARGGVPSATTRQATLAARADF